MTINPVPFDFRSRKIQIRNIPPQLRWEVSDWGQRKTWGSGDWKGSPGQSELAEMTGESPTPAPPQWCGGLPGMLVLKEVGWVSSTAWDSPG